MTTTHTHTYIYIIHKRRDGFMRSCQAGSLSLTSQRLLKAKPGRGLVLGMIRLLQKYMLQVLLFVQWPNCWWYDVHSTLVQCCGTIPESFHSQDSTDEEKYSQVAAACTERELQHSWGPQLIYLQSLPSEFAARMAQWLSFYGEPNSKGWSSRQWCLHTFVEHSHPSSCSQKMSHLLSWGGANCSMKFIKV